MPPRDPSDPATLPTLGLVGLDSTVRVHSPVSAVTVLRGAGPCFQDSESGWPTLRQPGSRIGPGRNSEAGACAAGFWCVCVSRRNQHKCASVVSAAPPCAGQTPHADVALQRRNAGWSFCLLRAGGGIGRVGGRGNRARGGSAQAGRPRPGPRTAGVRRCADARSALRVRHCQAAQSLSGSRRPGLPPRPRRSRADPGSRPDSVGGCPARPGRSPGHVESATRGKLGLVCFAGQSWLTIMSRIRPASVKRCHFP